MKFWKSLEPRCDIMCLMEFSGLSNTEPTWPKFIKINISFNSPTRVTIGKKTIWFDSFKNHILFRKWSFFCSSPRWIGNIAFLVHLVSRGGLLYKLLFALSSLLAARLMPKVVNYGSQKRGQRGGCPGPLPWMSVTSLQITFSYKPVICQARDKVWPDMQPVWSDKKRRENKMYQRTLEMLF